MIVIVNKPKQMLAGLLFAGVVLCCSPAQAATLWYNGNRDNRDAFINQTSAFSGGAGADGVIYENFVVPTGTVWKVTGVFSNDLLNPLFGAPAPTTAAWSILSGVSAGNGGTVVASGDGTDHFATTGRTSTVFSPFTATEYKNEVDGLSVTLTAGTYWLSVAIDTDGAQDAYWYVSTTSGAGAIGTPPGNDGNSFFSSNQTGDFFTPTSDLEGPGTWDYSLGVVGVLVPEPSVVTLALGASVSLVGYSLLGNAYRRRKIATAASAA